MRTWTDVSPRYISRARVAEITCDFFESFFLVFQVFGSFFGFAKEIWGFFLFLQVCLSNLRFFENFLQLFMLCIQMSAAESVQMNDEILHWIRIGWYVDCQR